MDAYDQLTHLVDRGELALYLIISPPRTLSTVWGKVFSEASDVGGWVKEPAAQFHAGEGRVAQTYTLLLHAAQTCRPGADGIRRLVVSIIAVHIGLTSEAHALFRLARKISFIVRNPVLALESHIRLIGHIVGLSDSAPTSSRALLAEGWVEPGTDLEPIADASPWSSLLAHASQTKDYRALTERFWVISNRIHATRSYRRELWESLRDTISAGPLGPAGPDQIAHAEAGRPWATHVEACLSLPALSLREASPVLFAPLRHAQGGWLQVRRLYEIAECHFAPALAGIVVATELQMRPTDHLEALQQRMGLSPRRETSPALALFDGYRVVYERTRVTADTLFSRAYASTAIAAPATMPLALHRFPRFMQAAFKNTLGAYLFLISQPDQHLLSDEDTSSLIHRPVPAPEGRGPARPLLHIDPIYAYATVAAKAPHGPDREAAQNEIRGIAPAFTAYFEMIDTLAARPPTRWHFREVDRHLPSV